MQGLIVSMVDEAKNEFLSGEEWVCFLGLKAMHAILPRESDLTTEGMYKHTNEKGALEDDILTKNECSLACKVLSLNVYGRVFTCVYFTRSHECVCVCV